MIELHAHAFGSISARAALQRLRALGRLDTEHVAHLHRAAGQDAELWPELWARVRHGDATGWAEAYTLRVPLSTQAFAAFSAKYSILTSAAELLRQPTRGPLLPPVAEELRWLISTVAAQWRQVGVLRGELRCMLPGRFTLGQARQALGVLLDACAREGIVDLVLSVPRARPLHHWDSIEHVLRHHPQADHLVAVDLCHQESSEQQHELSALVSVVRSHNAACPQRALALLVHVGEQYADCSLEEACRRVWTAADCGAQRLGHALIAGIASEALAGQERTQNMAQWLAEHRNDAARLETLIRYGVWPDAQSYADEERRLASAPAQRSETRCYRGAVLKALAARQEALRVHLRASGVVVEVCPSSNRILGGISNPAWHPLHALLQAQIPVAIGSDDGGIFATDLAQEWALVQQWTGFSSETLAAWQAQHQNWASRALMRA